MERLIIKTEYVVNSELWKLFPVINCDKVKDIPCDYLGAIGVPITALDKIGRNDGHSGLEILDLIHPKANGKQLYKRLIVRNLKPKLPEEINLIEYLRNAGIEIELEERRGNNEQDKSIN